MSSRQRSIWSLEVPLSTIQSPSFNISMRSSVPNMPGNSNIWSNDDLENRENNSQKKGSPKWAFIRCCLIGSLLAGILLAIALALWLTSSSKTTSTTLKALTMTQSSSTSTTSTTTSVSSTTTTTTTSTTATSTTTTSTSTTATTATTTTTTDTSTTTTTDSTTTTPPPPCAPTSVGSSSTLFTTSSGSSTTYTCYAYAWTSPVTGSVTLAFQLRHDPDYWFLDDVSVYYGSSQMLINGDFETGSFSSWVKTTPNGNCGGIPIQVSSASPYSGSYSVRDGCNGVADQIGQQFTAIAGEVYIVSFWLKSSKAGSGISALVTLS